MTAAPTVPIVQVTREATLRLTIQLERGERAALARLAAVRAAQGARLSLAEAARYAIHQAIEANEQPRVSEAVEPAGAGR